MVKKNKMRDISRGVLPATRNRAQSAAEELAYERRHNRRQIAQELGQIRSLDDAIEAEADLEVYPNAKINSIVNERRLADNLGALMRWARSKISGELAHLSDDDRYMWFKTHLPDSLQGRHALQHIEMDLLEPSWSEFRWWRYLRSGRRPDGSREEVIEMLAYILETHGLHSRFNEYMKTADYVPKFINRRNWAVKDRFDPNYYYEIPNPSWHEPVLLLGHHDVEAWVDRCGTNPHNHYYACLRNFLEEVMS